MPRFDSETPLTLPVRATVNDVEMICGYLLTKPTGATVNEAKAVLDPRILDPRKIAAFKFWGLIDDSTGKMRLTERGRGVGKDKGARKATSLRAALAEVAAYRAILERSVHRSELTAGATEVAAHWHQHFRSDASDSDELINQQAICFFQLAEGADLGRLIVGRKGQPTRFEFDEVTAHAFVAGSESTEVSGHPAQTVEQDPDAAPELFGPQHVRDAGVRSAVENGNRVFITHGKNKKILEQIKRTVVSVGLEPVVSMQHETAAKPVPQKVMDDMRSCGAAVIHVGAEAELTDKDGKGHRQINPNVLIEIGAAMALYRERFVLVVEDGIELPSNLQGLYQSRYTGDGLDFDAGMKIQEALRGLT
jgi:predicted nucleotide-binding protein